MNYTHLNKYLKTLGKKIQEEVKKNVPESTGKLRSSIKSKVEFKKGIISVKIDGLKYGLVLDKGYSGYLNKRDTPYTIKASKAAKTYIRGNTVYTPWTSIRDWVKREGIGGKDWKSAAYLINRKLKLQGKSATNWISKASKKALKTQTYRKNIATALLADVKDHFKNKRYIR